MPSGHEGSAAGAASPSKEGRAKWYTAPPPEEGGSADVEPQVTADAGESAAAPAVPAAGAPPQEPPGPSGGSWQSKPAPAATPRDTPGSGLSQWVFDPKQVKSWTTRVAAPAEADTAPSDATTTTTGATTAAGISPFGRRDTAASPSGPTSPHGAGASSGTRSPQPAVMSPLIGTMAVPRASSRNQSSPSSSTPFQSPQDADVTSSPSSPKVKATWSSYPCRSFRRKGSLQGARAAGALNHVTKWASKSIFEVDGEDKALSRTPTFTLSPSVGSIAVEKAESPFSSPVTPQPLSPSRAQPVLSPFHSRRAAAAATAIASGASGSEAKQADDGYEDVDDLACTFMTRTTSVSEASFAPGDRAADLRPVPSERSLPRSHGAAVAVDSPLRSPVMPTHRPNLPAQPSPFVIPEHIRSSNPTAAAATCITVVESPHVTPSAPALFTRSVSDKRRSFSGLPPGQPGTAVAAAATAADDPRKDNWGRSNTNVTYDFDIAEEIDAAAEPEAARDADQKAVVDMTRNTTFDFEVAEEEERARRRPQQRQPQPQPQPQPQLRAASRLTLPPSDGGGVGSGGPSPRDMAGSAIPLRPARSWTTTDSPRGATWSKSCRRDSIQRHSPPNGIPKGTLLL